MGYQLLHNNWFGKALGFTSAWIWAPDNTAQLSILIILGVAVGHLYDAWALQQASQNTRQVSQPAIAMQNADSLAYAQYLFCGLGYIAKAGGVVQAAHITYTEQLLHSSNADAAARTQAIKWFNDGKRGRASMASLARRCWGKESSSHRQRNTILHCFCTMAAIAPTNNGLNALKHLGVLLGFAPALIGKEFGNAKSQQAAPAQPSPQRSRGNHTHTRSNSHKHTHSHTHRQSQQSSNSGARTRASPQAIPAAVTEAYTCLDLRSPANLSQVKQAYRRMVSRYHPDRLPRNATAAEIKHAEQRMVEMRTALETLQAHLTK